MYTYFYSVKIRDTTCNIDQSRRVGLCYRFVTYFYTTDNDGILENVEQAGIGEHHGGEEGGSAGSTV